MMPYSFNYISLRNILLIIILVPVCYIMVQDRDILYQIWEKIYYNTSPWLMGSLLLLSLVNYMFRSIRWLVLVRPFVPNYHWQQAVLDFVTAFAFTMTPAKAGELIRVHYLRKRFKLSYSTAFIPSLYDRLYDFLILFLVTMIGACFYQTHHLGITVMCGIGAGLSLFLYRPKLFLYPIRFSYKITHKAKRLHAKLLGFCKSCDLLKSASVRISAFILGLFGWGAEFFAFYLLCHAFGLTLSFGEVSFIFAASTLAGALLMTPGGMGGAEAVMISLLMLYHIPLELATSLTFIIRITTLWFAVILGIICLPFHRI